VARTGRSILVMESELPVAELRPHRPPSAPSLIGLHKGRVAVQGDIIAPLGPKHWKVLR
jgi:antitoxin (DNA-binding transcriptional repressor) of toxin-antitoxin stability system